MLLSVVCITPYIKSLYESFVGFNSKLMVCDSGVNYMADSEFPGGFSSGDEKRNYVIGYAGGLHPERDIETLMRSAAELPEMKFLLMGGRKELINKLKRFAHEIGAPNISFLDYMKFTDMRKVMLSKCDAFLYTRSSGLDAINSSPLKLFDYFNYGKPIVSVDNQSTDGYFHYPGVFRYQSENVESLVKALKNAKEFSDSGRGVDPYR